MSTYYRAVNGASVLIGEWPGQQEALTSFARTVCNSNLFFHIVLEQTFRNLHTFACGLSHFFILSLGFQSNISTANQFQHLRSLFIKKLLKWCKTTSSLIKVFHHPRKTKLLLLRLNFSQNCVDVSREADFTAKICRRAAVCREVIWSRATATAATFVNVGNLRDWRNGSFRDSLLLSFREKLKETDESFPLK